MGQSPPALYLATRFADWHQKARMYHRLIRGLVEAAVEVDIPGDGTVLVKLPYAEWRAVCAEATNAPPEPLNGPTHNDDTPAAPK